MAAFLASLLTLVGTLAVAGLGYWQWRRTQAKDQAKEYHAKRVEVLGQLWTELTVRHRRRAAQGDRRRRWCPSGGAHPPCQLVVAAIRSLSAEGRVCCRFGDVGLSVNSPARNAGQCIAGINDGFSGSAPDIGAFEYVPG